MNPQRIALFGGTFDPVHLGHTAIAEAAVAQLSLDRVLFIPCRQSPHKPEASLASEEERLNMLRLATAELPWAKLNEIETCLPPPSYSWMTAESIHESNPEARLFWLLGEDQWSVLDSWDRPTHLAELVEFIIHSRGGEPPPKSGFRAHFIRGDHPASGRALRAGAPNGLHTDWLHPKVEQFIRSRGLYGWKD